MCGCVYTHTRTHYTDGVLGCEPRSRDKTPGGPEESRWTKSWHIFVFVYKVHTCIHMLKGGMRSWTNCFFLLTCLFSWEKQKVWRQSANHSHSLRWELKTAPWEFQTKLLHYFFLSNNKSNLHFTMCERKCFDGPRNRPRVPRSKLRYQCLIECWVHIVTVLECKS